MTALAAVDTNSTYVRLSSLFFSIVKVQFIQSQGINLSFVSEQLFKTSTDPISLYISHRMLNNYGKVYFARKTSAINGNRNPTSFLYFPLPPEVVQDNLRDRAALREFKQRYIKIMTRSVSKSATSSNFFEIPERVNKVLRTYSEGLKQVVFKNHQWVVNGIANITLNSTEIARGCELLEFLELSPTLRNAKKVLEIMGVWSQHENVEKYIMRIRDEFPAEVLAEAQYLLDNWKLLQDPDERCHFG